MRIVEVETMKRTIALCLVMVILGSLCLTGCGSSGGSLDLVSYYMYDDDTIEVKFRNETNKTITYVDGSLNLFTGSATSQTPIKRPSFTWEGSCSKGSTFTVTVRISGAPAGLADAVNRVGFSVAEIR